MIREESVGWDFKKFFWAFAAVGAREETSEGVAEGLVRIGLFVEGEIVVIVVVDWEEEEEEEEVSPLAGRVEVLSWVMLDVVEIGLERIVVDL